MSIYKIGFYNEKLIRMHHAFRGVISMSNTNKALNKSRNKTSYVLPIFFGIGIGAFLGLIAYVKYWF